jgi:CheY-like chemotaxis protein
MAGENLLVVDDSPTILKAVEAALTRAGFHVDTAGDVSSGMALARARRPAVILVDSLIPGDAMVGADAGSASAIGVGGAGVGVKGTGDSAGETGGFRLCGALAADSTLAQTPVVLMTARGEDLESRYAQSPNVIDYITKPFSPDAVLAVVTHVIEKTASGATNAATGDTKSVTPAKNAVAEALSKSIEPARDDPPDRSLDRSLDRLIDRLAETLERHRQDVGAWDIGVITRGALSNGKLASLLADAGFEAIADSGGPDIAGQLGAVSMSEVLMLLAHQGQDGTLRVQTDGARVDVWFGKGHIDLAAAVGVAEEFLLGRFTVESGDVTPDALAQVLDERARASGRPPLFGRDLVARGLLTEDQLKAAMRRQTAELVYETLRWSRGSFHFRRTSDRPEIVTEAVLGISVDTLLLEGFRRVDEWRLIERDISSFDLVFVRDEGRIGALPRGTLTREEIAVLDALNARSSVRDIIRGLRMGSFDVSKILYRLLRTELIRRRVQPAATV